jgi:hypothetical protein
MAEDSQREVRVEAMRRNWSEALWRFQHAPRTTDHRMRQVEVVAAIRDLLEPICSAETLAAHYCCRTSAERCRLVARTLYPGDELLEDPRRTRDVAYALRCVELLTGQMLDPTLGLPYWIGEWAVY